MNRYAVFTPFLWMVVIVCLLPTLLIWLGIDFSIPPPTSDLVGHANVYQDAATDKSHCLARELYHMFLDWSVALVAVFTFLLAIAYYLVKRDISTLVIGTALLFAGAAEVFYFLVAQGVIQSIDNNHHFVPYTWVTCRLFHVLVLSVAAGMLLIRSNEDQKFKPSHLVSMGLFFFTMASAVIYVCLAGKNLPQTVFQDLFIVKPWDLLILVLFIITGFALYRPCYAKYNTFFSYSLILSVLPEAGIELHMGLGSTVLFDNHFNMARLLTVISQLILFTGLYLDFIYVFKEQMVGQNKKALHVEYQANEDQRERDSFLKYFLSSIQDGFSILDREMKVLYANRTMERWNLHNLPLKGKKCYNVFFGKEVPCDGCPANKVLTTGHASAVVLPKQDSQGRPKQWFHVNVLPLFDAHKGEYCGIIEHIRDITDEKKLRQEANDKLTTLSRENEDLKRFSYFTLHDLKAPLRSIDELSRWILEDLEDFFNEDTRRNMNLLRKSVHKMEEEVADKLKNSRFEQNNNITNCEKERVDPARVSLCNTRKN